MQILVNLGKSPLLKHRSRALALSVRPILEALVTANQVFLRHHKTPSIYRSGVRYKEEPAGTTEEFAAIPVVLSRGWGDCDDLASWRVAELREVGEKAKIRLTWKRMTNGGKLFHVVVRRGDGTIEDPSLLLGMGKHLL